MDNEMETTSIKGFYSDKGKQYGKYHIAYRGWGYIAIMEKKKGISI